MLLLDDVNLLALLIAPVQGVDVAGNDRQKKGDTTGRTLCPGSSIGVICQAYIPV